MVEEGRHLGINLDTIKVQVAVNKTPSRFGLSRKRWALVAEGLDGQPHIQLGTPGELEGFAQIEKDFGSTPTIEGAYRQQDTFLGFLAFTTMSTDMLRRKFLDGDKLVEGPQSFPVMPGKDPVPDSNRITLWAPASTALGEEWFLTDL